MKEKAPRFRSPFCRGRVIPLHSEVLALTIVGEVVDELEMMEPIVKMDEMRSMLQQILAELQKPGVHQASSAFCLARTALSNTMDAVMIN